MEKEMEKKILWVGLGSTALVLIAAIALMFVRQQAYRGAVIDPAGPAPEIALTDMNGGPFSLADLRGKIVLVYFGFTNCPDICPLTLAKTDQALTLLGPQAAEVQVILVTTDPTRDTPERIKGYVTNFNPAFMGLTGSLETLQQVWDEYGVTVLDNGETHSTRTYVVDRNGDLRLTFPAEMTAEDIAHDLNVLLSQK